MLWVCVGGGAAAREEAGARDGERVARYSSGMDTEMEFGLVEARLYFRLLRFGMTSWDPWKSMEDAKNTIIPVFNQYMNFRGGGSTLAHLLDQAG